MKKSVITELEVLIRARYPLIGVESFEEARVVGVLARIAQARQKRLMLWSQSRGFYTHGAPLESSSGADDSTRDPLAALDHVVKLMEPAIFVMFDFHPNLANPLVVRRLREVGAYLKTSYKSLVLVSPRLSIPLELEKEISVLEFGLPSREELTILLRRTVEEVNRKSGLGLKVEPEVEERLT